MCAPGCTCTFSLSLCDCRAKRPVISAVSPEFFAAFPFASGASLKGCVRAYVRVDVCVCVCVCMLCVVYLSCVFCVTRQVSVVYTLRAATRMEDTMMPKNAPEDGVDLSSLLGTLMLAATITLVIGYIIGRLTRKLHNRSKGNKHRFVLTHLYLIPATPSARFPVAEWDFVCETLHVVSCQSPRARISFVGRYLFHLLLQLIRKVLAHCRAYPHVRRDRKKR